MNDDQGRLDKWWTDKSIKPFASFPKRVIQCHAGNKKIIEGSNGGGLYAGGWTRDACPGDDWVVIDLASYANPDIYTSDPRSSAMFVNTLQCTYRRINGPILHLPIRDFDTPRFGQKTWDALTQDIKRILDSGGSILVACDGGHGRTGLVVAIIASMLYPHLVGNDPVEWIRSVYCEYAIETVQQEYYVYDTLGIERPHTCTTHTPYQYSMLPDDSNTDIQEPCVLCGLDGTLDREGICEECALVMTEDPDEQAFGECDYCGLSDFLNENNICKSCMGILRSKGLKP